ncbi:MAG: dual specificity protein phosphatase family protein [Planctomycetes bacterium]|nr:dual specificity protein phosphatase family protein [Planctomycetota bacterium]
MNIRLLSALAIILLATFMLIFAGDTGCATKPPPIDRPAIWAQPLKVPGVPNLYRVDENLYRSAQPTAEGMRYLKKMGVKTIVNLRSFHSDRDEIGEEGLGYEHLHMQAWHPEREEAVRFLQIAVDFDRAPVLVHCRHGADRTGTLCALYRIAVQGWTKEEALREMTEGGFGYHEIWSNLPRWIDEMDIESIRRDAGVNGHTDERTE